MFSSPLVFDILLLSFSFLFVVTVGDMLYVYVTLTPNTNSQRDCMHVKPFEATFGCEIGL